MNAYWLWLHATRQRFATPYYDDRGRDVALAAALVDGWRTSFEMLGLSRNRL